MQRAVVNLHLTLLIILFISLACLYPLFSQCCFAVKQETEMGSKVQSADVSATCSNILRAEKLCVNIDQHFQSLDLRIVPDSVREGKVSLTGIEKKRFFLPLVFSIPYAAQWLQFPKISTSNLKKKEPMKFSEPSTFSCPNPDLQMDRVHCSARFMDNMPLTTLLRYFLPLSG